MNLDPDSEESQQTHGYDKKEVDGDESAREESLPLEAFSLGLPKEKAPVDHLALEDAESPREPAQLSSYRDEEVRVQKGYYRGGYTDDVPTLVRSNASVFGVAWLTPQRFLSWLCRRRLLAHRIRTR